MHSLMSFVFMPVKTAEIIVTCAFDELFIKSIGKQQIGSSSKITAQ